MQPTRTTNLPQPDADSAAHSRRVVRHIRERIAAAGGEISFAEFMQLALYAPGLGYYSAGASKFGEAGDFVTAPEVSPVFGRVLARQCAPLLATAGLGDVLEFGAGSGRLASDLLGALAELDALPDRYAIVEVSADLRERQRRLLRAERPGLAERVEWLERLPESFSGVVVANEVADALPVERFVRRAEGIVQICVGIDGEGLVLRERKAPAILERAVGEIETDLERCLPDGYVSEVGLAARAWMSTLAELLTRGFAFVFDYGVSRREYYADERRDGWLRCHFRHHAHNDPLLLPGVQDITAWVDFTALAGAAVAGGLDVAGYVTQANFLLDGGLTDELAGMAELPTNAQLALSGQVKRLTLPGEMGEHFKCLGLQRGIDVRPPGFAADRTASL